MRIYIYLLTLLRLCYWCEVCEILGIHVTTCMYYVTLGYSGYWDESWKSSEATCILESK